MKLKLSLGTLCSVFFLLSGENVVLGRAGKEVEQCAVCYKLASHVEKRLLETEARAEEKISIGVRIGASGESVPKTVIRYGDSEQRLLEILEGACNDSPNKAYCMEILHQQDNEMSDWFHEHRTEPFGRFICDGGIKGCSEKVAESFNAPSNDVEIEDEDKKAMEAAAARKLEEEAAAKKKAAEAARNAAAAEDAKKAAAAEDAKKAKGEEPVFDVIALVQKLVTRIKNNTIRTKNLAIELYGELSGIARNRDWEKLKTMVKNPSFYLKYLNVFLWVFLGLYCLFSMVEMLIPKTTASRAAAGSGRSASGNVGAKRRTGKVKKDE